MNDQLPNRISTIRARAREHQQEIDSLRWFTPARLAARWDVSATTVMEISIDDLPYKAFGSGKKLKRRRYHPDDVAKFEASGRTPASRPKESVA